MAVNENQVSVDLVQYIDSLRGTKLDYDNMDCVRLVQGWLPEKLRELPTYTAKDWRRKIYANGWENWHLHASDYLAVRDGAAKVGDIVWTHGQYRLPAFGIARDAAMGYFVFDKGLPDESPIVLVPFQKPPVWVGRID